ncbi:MAG: peptide chain release factor N(5)-glutamine methyltransferase, partial [Lewinella sp.]|nr:peptide chain release factor N(5)-glutamine methyltransferase [Lewinella sp.]
MTTQELYEDLQSGLLTHYDAGEAASISRIVLEDAFDLHLPLTEREIRPEEEQLYRHIRFRLMRGEPVQYILGEADFYGLKFRVDTRVLIPRQETEELVHWVLDSWKQAGKKPGLKILDIGTGSGCIPITLKKQAPVLEITGLDIESDILALAEENAIFNQVEVKWLQADILEESRWEELGSFDYIVSNPPYIPPSQQKLMPRHVLEHEPHLALFVPENDPLLFYREIGLF